MIWHFMTLMWHCCNALRWRHNERDGVSNHQPHYCILNRLFRRRSKKTSKLRVTGLCEGNSPVTGEFPAQRASNAENAFIWWRHHGTFTATFVLVPVIGCADLSAPSHGWLRRDGDSVEVGCDNTPERWHLSCNEGTWVGVVGNCTAGMLQGEKLCRRFFFNSLAHCERSIW